MVLSRYYVNKEVEKNGYHEVHKSGCSSMPDHHDLRYLGDFSNCRPAMHVAKRIYVKSNGCWYCSKASHTA